MDTWINKSVFYHIYPLGFCGAPQFNNKEEEKISRILKIIEWIPHFKKMGINALYLGPIFESGEHGYDTEDYKLIDKRLGDEEDFKKVCEELHKNKIRIVLDGVFNHVGRNFFAFKDIIKNGKNSRYCNWFKHVNFNYNSPMGDEFTYDAWEGHYNLVKLNHGNEEVEEYLFDCIGSWIDRFDIDGIRIDAADCIDKSFFKKLKKFCKAKKESFWLMGEVIHGDYSKWVNDEMLDSVTNYECYKGIYSSHNDKNYFEIAHSLNRQFSKGGIYKDIVTYNFVDNHDVNRIASNLNNKEHIKNVYTLLFTMPGIPSIYYGSEWGIEGVKGIETDAPLRPELNLSDIVDNELSYHIQKLSRLKIHIKALQEGEYEQVIVRNEELIFKRKLKEENVYVLLNLSEYDFIASFQIGNEKCLEEILGKYEIINAGNRYVDIKVPRYSSRILIERDIK